ncbi:MAG: DMT family transporter [Patescibacteria group bacterium]
MSFKLNNFISDLGLFYAAAIWGSTFFIVKDSLNSIDPVVMVSYRFLLSAFLMAIPLLFLRKKLFSNFKPGLILGILLWFIYVPQTVGLAYTTASNSGFITGIFVAFVPVFSFMFFRKFPTPTRTLAVIISVIGLWLLTGGLTDFNFGDMITVITAMAYAAHILAADVYAKNNIDPYIISFQQFFVTGILSLLSGLILGLPFSITSTKAIWVIAFLAIFPGLLAFVIQMRAQKSTSPIKVSLIFALEPVFAAIFAWTFGNEPIIAHRAIGGLFIFIAMIISELSLDKYLVFWKKPKK